MRSLNEKSKWSTNEVIILASGQVMVDPFYRGRTVMWCERKRRILFCKILSSSWTWRMWSAAKSTRSCKCIWLVNSHRPYIFSTNQTVLITRGFYFTFPFDFIIICHVFFIACIGIFVGLIFSLLLRMFAFVILIFLAFALVKLHSISDITDCLCIVAWSGSSFCMFLYFINFVWSSMSTALSATISNVKLISISSVVQNFFLLILALLILGHSFRKTKNSCPFALSGIWLTVPLLHFFHFC